MTDQALEIKNLSVEYILKKGSKTAVKDISFQIKQGEASLSPNVSLKASIASGFSFPLNLAKIIVAGSPGISLGMKKFRVNAAKAAIK